MMFKCILILVAMRAIAQVCSAVPQIPNGSDSCSYYRFLTQPPLTLDCEPYDRVPINRITWRLRISCEVERISSDAGTFDVHWFRRDPVTGNVTNLGRIELNSATPDILHIVYGWHILNDDFVEDMLGDYWCQVINTTATPNNSLGISNILTILHPDQYNSSLDSCSNTLRNKTMTCADFADEVPAAPIETTPMSSSLTQTTEQPIGVTQTHPSTSHESVPSITDTESTATSSIDHSTTSLPHYEKQPSSSPAVLHTHTPSSHAPSTSSQVPPLSTSATTWLSSSKDKTSTTYTLIPTMAPDDETPPGINVLLSYHSLYVVAIMVVVAVSGLLVLTVCMRKRIKKAFVKKSANVGMLEITAPQNTNTTATRIPTGDHSQETLRSQCRTLRPLLPLPTPPVSAVSNSSEYYEEIYDSTSGSTPEYIMVVGDTQYEPLQCDTMDYIPGYCMTNKDVQYKSLQTNTMNPVHKYSSVANTRTVKHNMKP